MVMLLLYSVLHAMISSHRELTSTTSRLSWTGVCLARALLYQVWSSWPQNLSCMLLPLRRLVRFLVACFTEKIVLLLNTFHDSESFLHVVPHFNSSNVSTDFTSRVRSTQLLQTWLRKDSMAKPRLGQNAVALEIRQSKQHEFAQNFLPTVTARRVPEIGEVDG